MSAKKKPEPAAPAAQEPQQEEKGADPTADSQPSAKPADAADTANQPTDTEPPAGPDAEPDPQQDPEPPAHEESSPAPQAEDTAAPDDTELAQVKAALLAANCEIAAYKAGVDSAMAADAITLARAEAGPGADEAAIAAAMRRVLERHPEWKAPAAAKKTTGGFQLGADPDAAAKPTAPQKDPAGAKRWNRFK